jgi:hypothetical protein
MAKQTNREKLKETFREKLLKHVNDLNSAVATKTGDWVIKGFIDIARNIYTISADTKVISKVMELLLFPKICDIAQENSLRIVLCKEQNFYPDITFIDDKDNKYALDLKSTYRRNAKQVNGMTLGAFTGYFRNRSSRKNITFPYQDYVGHFVLGVIYSRAEAASDERKVYRLTELQNITSVVRDFSFFLQEKYKIAAGRPGSGNTKNIGSVTKIDDLINGKGPFSDLGEALFDDYWMYYMAKDMAKAVDLDRPPYKNLEEYKRYKKLCARK